MTSDDAEVETITTAMVTSTDRNLRPRLPEGRHECLQVILVGHHRQPGEDIPQVKQGIDSPAVAGNDDRVQDRGALAGLGMADKKPIFDSKLGRTDAVFYSEIAIMPRSRGDGRQVTRCRPEKRRVQLGMIAGLIGIVVEELVVCHWQ